MKQFSKFTADSSQLTDRNLLLFLVFLFLPTQLGKHYWLDFSFINSLRIDYYSPTVYFWDLLLIFTLVVFVFVVKLNLNKAAVSLGFIFLLSQAVSLLDADNLGAGLVRLFQYAIAMSFGIMVASLNWSESEKRATYLGLVIGILVESSIAIWQFILGHSVGLWILGERSITLATFSIATFNWYGQIFLRPYSTFPHPNVLAAYVVLVFFLLNYFLPKTGKKADSSGGSLVHQLSLGLGALAGLLSFSRGAILILAILSFLYFRKRWRVLLLITLFCLPFLFVRFNSAFNFDSLSISRREELAEVATGQFIKNPLSGVGLNNFIMTASSENLIAGPIRFLQPVHNIFLLVVAETGLLGLTGFLLLIGCPIYGLWKQRGGKGQLILLSSWGSILFLGFFDHYFLTIGQGQRLFFLIWGLSMLEYSKEENRKVYALPHSKNI